MKIPELFEKKKPVFSLEIFPPKRKSGLEKIYDTIEKLTVCKPDFISVTYGAGGNIANNDTCDIAANIKKKFGDNALSIFIQPPSVEVLRQRLTGRGTDAPEKIEQRLAKAEYEMTFADKFDTIIVNDKLEEAFREAEKKVRDFLK